LDIFEPEQLKFYKPLVGLMIYEALAADSKEGLLENCEL
jgi:hypothetical protein